MVMLEVLWTSLFKNEINSEEKILATTKYLFPDMGCPQGNWLVTNLELWTPERGGVQVVLHSQSNSR